MCICEPLISCEHLVDSRPLLTCLCPMSIQAWRHLLCRQAFGLGEVDPAELFVWVLYMNG